MRTLLIDADVLAYKAATVVERQYEWEPGHWTWHADEEEARIACVRQIEHYMDALNGTDFKLCLTDTTNFRKAILPTYKAHRAGTKKPLVLMALRAWMVEEKGAYIRPSLEGDDVMGILATWRKLKGEKVIVSIDKDMKTIPGLVYRDAETGIVEVSEQDADYWHLFQTLTGDTTDGYSGCPGVGPKGAEALIGSAPPFGTLREAWEFVVAKFVKAKLSEHEALVQARVARILRASDYDFKTKQPILWRPPT